MGSDSEGDSAAARLRGAKAWVLLDGSRTLVAAVTAGLVFVALLAVSASEISPLENTSALLYAFSGLISGNLTVVTVVVAINQLLLSRELRTPSQLESEIDGMVDYRKRVEDAANRVAPVEPLGFLRLTYESTREQAQKLGGLSLTETDEAVADDVDEVVTKITRKADRVDGLLKESDVGTFQVLSTTLNTNYAREINQLRQIKWRHGNALPADATDCIDDLVDRLQDIDIARQYFKTVYLQQELASVSRLLFYTGLPAVVVVAATLLVFTESSEPPLARPVLTVLFPAVVTVGLFPLTVLFAYILRTATVARRTAAIIPFTAPSQETGEE